MDSPVEAEHTLIAHDAFALNHDVVARLGVEIILVLAGEHHVVPDDCRVEEEFRVITRQGIETVAAFDPVAAFIAHKEVNVGAAEDEVVAFTGKDFRAIDANEEDVLAIATHQNVQAVRVGDEINTTPTLDEIDRKSTRLNSSH